MISTNEHSAGTSGKVTLEHIESLTKEYAGRHEAVAQAIQKINGEVEAIRNKYLPALKRAVGEAGAAKLTLHTAIQGAPGLFDKPRTYTFHGIKVGLQKGKGGIEFDDADKVVALIEKHFGAEAAAYLTIKKSPDKSMLEVLPAVELKKIGCNIGSTEDKVVIKATDGEIEKTVAALLKDAVETEA